MAGISNVPAVAHVNGKANCETCHKHGQAQASRAAKDFPEMPSKFLALRLHEPLGKVLGRHRFQACASVVLLRNGLVLLPKTCIIKTFGKSVARVGRKVLLRVEVLDVIILGVDGETAGLFISANCTQGVVKRKNLAVGLRVQVGDEFRV